ncbi:hypothetical protein AGR4B_Cc80219 [Agrobacterium tumefaciens str. CFBP 5621]|nr:hypothetical protein AGR4B_Cc80219 [Agrobacterium tumefaciens str. CFBP 5621]
MNELGCRAPFIAHVITFKTKKPAAKADRFLAPGLFSHLFNVAASRPAKSPRDKLAILPLPACVNAFLLVLSP